MPVKHELFRIFGQIFYLYRVSFTHTKHQYVDKFDVIVANGDKLDSVFHNIVSHRFWKF